MTNRGAQIHPIQDQVISLRDYFAGQALQGLLAYSHVNPMHGNYHENCTIANAAASAFNYADAMMSERSR